MFHIYIVVSFCQQKMFQKNLKKFQNVCPSWDQKLPEIGIPTKKYTDLYLFDRNNSS